MKEFIRFYRSVLIPGITFEIHKISVRFKDESNRVKNSVMFYDRLLWVRDKNKSVFKFCDDFVQPKRNGHFVNGIEFICFRCHCSLRSIL